MTVIIGVDPHKMSHTAVAVSTTEQELARTRVRAGSAQLEQLVAWAKPFTKRTWAIESAGGLGHSVDRFVRRTGISTKVLFKWWGRMGSNHRHKDYESLTASNLDC
jgi:transposase